VEQGKFRREEEFPFSYTPGYLSRGSLGSQRDRARKPTSSKGKVKMTIWWNAGGKKRVLDGGRPNATAISVDRIYVSDTFRFPKNQEKTGEGAGPTKNVIASGTYLGCGGQYQRKGREGQSGALTGRRAQPARKAGPAPRGRVERRGK